MTYIQLDPKARMDIGDNNYTLEYLIKNNEGHANTKNTLRWSVAGYFPSVDTLLADYIRNAPTRSSKVIECLGDVITCIKAAEKHIEELIHNKK
jgi:hypothetical protein